jgi:hypothetical protein
MRLNLTGERLRSIVLAVALTWLDGRRVGQVALEADLAVARLGEVMSAAGVPVNA